MKNNNQNNKVANTLDDLFKYAKDYKKSDYFRKMIKFCSKLKHLKPFNAQMVYTQMPGAVYVMYANQWLKDYHRILKPNARPLAVLNFSPVGYMFDLSDTLPDPNYNGPAKSDEELLWDLQHEFDAQITNEYRDEVLENLLTNLPYYGICLDKKFQSGSTYAGKIELLNTPIPTDFKYGKNKYMEYPLPYMLSVRNSAEKGELISTILHELGHFFCQHLSTPGNWDTDKERRILSHEAKEIEAEAISWLVCSRIGIKTQSEKYIAELLDGNDEVPDDISYQFIFRSANKISEMLEYQNATEGYLYKYDSEFKDKLDWLKSK